MRRRPALLPLVSGLAVMALAQLAAPLGSPPLYDGVVVQEPYRYLAPGPDQSGSATSFHASLPVQGTTNQQFVAATTESPPQAQLISLPGAFVVPAGVTTLAVSIEPVAAPAPPSNGAIAGNVYRFTVADQSGAALIIGPATPPTLVLRAPDSSVEATIARFSGGAWQVLATQPSGEPGIFQATVSGLGDFALIAAPAQRIFGLDPTVFGVIAVAALLLVALLGFLLVGTRRQPAAVHDSPTRRRPRPPKRRQGGRRRGGSR